MVQVPGRRGCPGVPGQESRAGPSLSGARGRGRECNMRGRAGQELPAISDPLQAAAPAGLPLKDTFKALQGQLFRYCCGCAVQIVGGAEERRGNDRPACSALLSNFNCYFSLGRWQHWCRTRLQHRTGLACRHGGVPGVLGLPAAPHLAPQPLLAPPAGLARHSVPTQPDQHHCRVTQYSRYSS